MVTGAFLVNPLEHATPGAVALTVGQAHDFQEYTLAEEYTQVEMGVVCTHEECNEFRAHRRILNASCLLHCQIIRKPASLKWAIPKVVDDAPGGSCGIF